MNTEQSAAVDTKTFAIGVLAVTACVLFVGFLFVSQQPAGATGMNDRGGDYVLLTQQISATTEAVVVVDAAAKQMIVYAFDYNNKTLEILQRTGLDQLPKPRDRAPAEQPERRQRQ
jgi:Na+/H+-translocating membrane pyrophosphatase